MVARWLQSGTSRAHFEMWCEDRRNGVIIADFAVQGTLAREILGSPAEVMTRAGIKASAQLATQRSLSGRHSFEGGGHMLVTFEPVDTNMCRG